MSNIGSHRWSIEDSNELYNVPAWGSGYFTINEKGHLAVTPHGPDGPGVDLPMLIGDLVKRGLQMPLLIRFGDILASRIRDLHGCFAKAIREYEYQAAYQAVFPIKVNQQRHVVEELIRYGAEYR